MNATQEQKPCGHRLWMIALIGLLAVIGIAYVRFQPELEANFKNLLTTMVVFLSLVLAFIWFLFLSRIRWRVRLLTLVVLLGTGVGFIRVIRVDGTVNGTGLPRLVWRWTKSHPSQFVSAAKTSVATLPPSTIPSGVSDVPQFFGPNRDGIIRGPKLDRDWNSKPPKELWRQPIGLGWSAFAVVGGRAYTQEQRKDDELITCYELLSGRLLWAHTNKVRFSQWQGGDGPRATPTIIENRLFAIGGTGVLDCIDATTGTLLWSHDVLQENKVPNLIWGISCSPLVFENKVIVTGGFTNGPTVLAFDREKGTPLWRAGTDKASYSSPIVAQFVDRRVILSVNAASLTAHDPQTGAIVLDYPWGTDKWPKAAQPIVIDGKLDGEKIFLSAGYGVGCVLLRINSTADGKFSATELWKNKMMKTQFNSPVVRDGYIYGLDDGLLACVDLNTGHRVWKDGRYGSGQSLLVDDLILIQSEPGPVVLAKASPDGFAELGRIPALSAKTWNYPTLAGKYLLLRNDQEVVCYEVPVQTSPQVASLNGERAAKVAAIPNWGRRILPTHARMTAPQ